MEKNNEFEIAYARFLVFLMALSVVLFVVGYAISSETLKEFTRYSLVTFVTSLSVPLFEKSQSNWLGIFLLMIYLVYWLKFEYKYIAVYIIYSIMVSAFLPELNSCGLSQYMFFHSSHFWNNNCNHTNKLNKGINKHHT